LEPEVETPAGPDAEPVPEVEPATAPEPPGSGGGGVGAPLTAPEVVPTLAEPVLKLCPSRGSCSSGSSGFSSVNETAILRSSSIYKVPSITCAREKGAGMFSVLCQ
jgi:hypothetical protein